MDQSKLAIQVNFFFESVDENHDIMPCCLIPIKPIQFHKY
jgi:hypothetical protein